MLWSSADAARSKSSNDGSATTMCTYINVVRVHVKDKNMRQRGGEREEQTMHV